MEYVWRYIFLCEILSKLMFLMSSVVWIGAINNQDTTESSTHASYLDILLSVDTDKKLTTKLYDKRDDFDFSIVNFPHLSSNIP